MGLGPMFFVNLLGGAGKRYSERKAEEREKQRRLDELEQENKYALERIRESHNLDTVAKQAEKMEEEARLAKQRQFALSQFYNPQITAELLKGGELGVNLALAQGKELTEASIDPNKGYKFINASNNPNADQLTVDPSIWSTISAAGTDPATNFQEQLLKYDQQRIDLDPNDPNYQTKLNAINEKEEKTLESFSVYREMMSDKTPPEVLNIFDTNLNKSVENQIDFIYESSGLMVNDGFGNLIRDVREGTRVQQINILPKVTDYLEEYKSKLNPTENATLIDIVNKKIKVIKTQFNEEKNRQLKNPLMEFTKQLKNNIWTGTKVVDGQTVNNAALTLEDKLASVKRQTFFKNGANLVYVPPKTFATQDERTDFYQKLMATHTTETVFIQLKYSQIKKLNNVSGADWKYTDFYPFIFVNGNPDGITQ